MINFITAVLLILFAAFSRLLPHPMNFTPVVAIALFSGVYFNKKYALLIPIAAMLISDSIIGFYSGIQYVYGSFVLVGLIGYWSKNRIQNSSAGKKVVTLGAVSLISSVLFFIITNFGVWMSGIYYDKTFAGLIQCYTMAIPFFRNSVAGDLVYTAAIFAVYELVTRFAVKPELTADRIRK